MSQQEPFFNGSHEPGDHSDRSAPLSPVFVSPQEPRQPQPPVWWGELVGVFCLIVLCDATIYRGEGFGGYALLFAAVPFLLWLCSSRRCVGAAFWLVGAMLLALSAKMAWCGSAGLVAIGFALIVAFAMVLAGFRPYVLEAAFFASQAPHAGYMGIIQYGRQSNQLGPVVPRASWMSIALPLLAFLVFGWMFILANPDLAELFGSRIKQAFDSLQLWIADYSPDLLEVCFWFATLWVVLGLLRPTIDRSYCDDSPQGAGGNAGPQSAESLMYPAVRNMLVTVIVLFAVYLVFEFKTLWFRVFPPGFHYSGYAHEGAAWLTAALALATVILSLAFRGRILCDPRVGTLRRLAWLWSLENMILAVAVYNRLFIYVGFNGMSRMRIVGLYGMSAVAVGFMLVVWKIVGNRDFIWLVRRHLWTLAFAVYLLALTPLDTIVVSYNVRRILNGDPAPSVQISVHPINSEGILLLRPLLECEDELIREGVHALLAEHHSQAEATAARRATLGWTTYQLADRIALEQCRKSAPHWKQYAVPSVRQPVLDRFHEYAYQWY